MNLLKGSQRYRVAAGRGETRAPGGAHRVAYARQKLTVYLTVSGAVAARDPRNGARTSGTTTRGEAR